jgi:serine/threonine kinase 32
LSIDNDGHIVLGDFGIARKLRPEENTIPCDDMLGTLAFTAPEMFMGKPYGREVDLWAFGVMLYELITGNVSLARSDT